MEHPVARYLTAITIVSAVLTVWTFSVASWLTPLSAVVFVIAAFAWNLHRGHPRPACAGCAAGCVRCRERI